MRMARCSLLLPAGFLILLMQLLFYSVPDALNCFQYFQKPGIIFRHHDAEPDKFAVQALEGAAVADHKIVFYAKLKYVEGSDIRFQNSEKQEVRVREIWLK